MNRREAMHAMVDGKKVRHSSWRRDCYLYLTVDGVLSDESGEYDGLNNFSGRELNENWDLYQEPNPHTPGTFFWAREEAKRGKVVYRPNFGQVGFRVEHFGPHVPWNLGHIDATDWESRDA